MLQSTGPIEVDLDLPARVNLPAGTYTVIGHIEWLDNGGWVEEPSMPPTTVIDEVYAADATAPLSGWDLAAFVAVHGKACREKIEGKVEAHAERHAEEMYR